MNGEGGCMGMDGWIDGASCTAPCTRAMEGRGLAGVGSGLT